MADLTRLKKEQLLKAMILLTQAHKANDAVFGLFYDELSAEVDRRNYQNRANRRGMKDA